MVEAGKREETIRKMKFSISKIGKEGKETKILEFADLEDCMMYCLSNYHKEDITIYDFEDNKEYQIEKMSRGDVYAIFPELYDVLYDEIDFNEEEYYD